MAFCGHRSPHLARDKAASEKYMIYMGDPARQPQLIDIAGNFRMELGKKRDRSESGGFALHFHNER